MVLDKVVVIKRPTALEELLRRHSTTSQVKFFLESRKDNYSFYSDAHSVYHEGLEKTLQAIPSNLRSQVVSKEHLGQFQFGEKDLVVVVGDDGLLVNVAKYVGTQPIIAVNPDTQRFDGVLSTCDVRAFPELLLKTLENTVSLQPLTMAQATLDDGQVMYALNDLFIGRSSHASARYRISYAGKTEQQSSSGIIVSTGTGSTGWLTSVMVGAQAIANRSTVRADQEARFDRDADYLKFVIREPFPSNVTGTSVVSGKITSHSSLTIVSHMPEQGIIFSDGIEKDYIEFTAGRCAIITPSEKKVYLVRRTKKGERDVERMEI